MKKIALLILTTIVLSSCQEMRLYSWYGYEESSYQYTKKQTPESLDRLTKDYSKIINKQRGTRKTVPPGIYAENAYLLIKAGKKEEGIAMFKKEVELYPESGIFIQRIIKQLEK